MSIQTLNLEGHLRDLATFREDHNLLPSIQLAAKTYFNSLSYDSNSHYISIKLFYLHFKCCPTSRSIPSLRILHPIQLVLENFFHYFFKFCPLFFSAKTYPQQESWLNIFFTCNPCSLLVLNWIFYLFTFQMLSHFLVSPLETPIPSPSHSFY